MSEDVSLASDIYLIVLSSSHLMRDKEQKGKGKKKVGEQGNVDLVIDLSLKRFQESEF